MKKTLGYLETFLEVLIPLESMLIVGKIEVGISITLFIIPYFPYNIFLLYMIYLAAFVNEIRKCEEIRKRKMAKYKCGYHDCRYCHQKDNIPFIRDGLLCKLVQF